MGRFFCYHQFNLPVELQKINSSAMFKDDPMRKKTRFSLTRTLIYLSPILLLTACNLGGDGKGGDSTIKIDQAGGEFNLSKDLSLFVPSNAVDQEIEITVREIASEEVNTLRQLPEDGESQLIAAFEILPHGQTFQSPVQIQIENIDYSENNLPLIYSLDLEDQSFQLAEIRTSYDRQSGDLILFLDHFSSYAAYLEEGYISPECQENPCRCEEISIEQSDAYNICSQDDCQVTESDVSVTFDACGGNTDHLLMREISPSCQPRMMISPDQEVIPVEGSTQVNVELGLSCAPFKNQDVFYSSNQLGQVDPIQTITDSAGKTETTFTAGEEPGTAEVTAEAFGSYYLLEITLNDESEYGKEKFYELEETTTIEIGNIQGTFEGSFNTCRGGFCVHDYQVRFDFTVDEIDWEAGSWTGTADVTQSGNVTTTWEDAHIEDVNTPDFEGLEIFGNAFPETEELDLLSLAVVNVGGPDDFYGTFLVVADDGGGSLELFILGFPLEVKADLDVEGIIPFRFKVDGSDTPQSGAGSLFLPNEDGPTMPGTYTLTLEY